MTSADLAFDGVLFFPVTPFDDGGAVARDVLHDHLESKLAHRPGGVFPACGTGELHALSASEAATVVADTVDIVAGRVPVVAGTGGSLGTALELARSAESAGADALLVLPPYLVTGPLEGHVRYVEQIAAATSLPVIVYHRGSAKFTADAMVRLAQNPKVVGFKDGTGDIGVTQEIVLAVSKATDDPFHFFNGLLTAELTQGAYRGIGMPLYSSAAFAFLPEIATRHYAAYVSGDDATRERILSEFYVPLVRLRDETPGFGVSLIKAGNRLRGTAVGGVRAPLVDPTDAQLARLQTIIDTGLALADELSA